jgi:hypothetical protein
LPLERNINALPSDVGSNIGAEREPRRRWIMRGERGAVSYFIRMFFLLLPFGLIAPCLQTSLIVMVAHLPGIGPTIPTTIWNNAKQIFVELLVLFPARTILTILANLISIDWWWIWPLAASLLGALIATLLRKRLSEFWLIAVAWGGACLISDVVVGQMAVASIFFLLSVIFNALGGLLVASLLRYSSWMVARVAH